MLYDCFMFFDELDVLDIRLHELASVVDKFVLVESTKTFRNKDKPLFYQENRHKFAEFADKIIHVVVADTPQTTNPWEIETFQRNAIMRGLTQCDPNDLVLISDVDEIPRATTVGLNGWQSVLGNSDFITFTQAVSYYYFNNIAVNLFWNGTRILKYRAIKTPQILRDTPGTGLAMAGWHMSYLGDAERIGKKIGAFAHSEYDTPEFNNPEHLAKCLESGKDLFNRPDVEFQVKPISECNLPQYVLDNLDRFRCFIKE